MSATTQPRTVSFETTVAGSGGKTGSRHALREGKKR